MEKKYYWISLIIIGVLVVGLILFLVIQKNGDESGDVLRPPLLVFDGQINVPSEQEAKNLIISNFDNIINNTMETCETERRYIDLREINSVNNDWQLDNISVELKEGYAPHTNLSRYDVTIFSGTTGNEERKICNNPSEQNSIDEQTGETSNCGGSGIKEIQIMNLKLVYIVDLNGKVYFVGIGPNYSYSVNQTQG